MNNLIYQILRFIFTPIFILYFNPTIIGKDKIKKDGSLLLVGNHKHALDPILVDVCSSRTIHALAKKELFDGPFGFFFRSIGAIPVDLDAKRNPKALQSGIDVLRNNGVINISPEAERNYTDEILLPFKKGAVIMSKETDTTILPYCIVGDYKFRSKNLKIVFGDYLEFKDIDIDKANEILFDTIKELLINEKDNITKTRRI